MHLTSRTLLGATAGYFVSAAILEYLQGKKPTELNTSIQTIAKVAGIIAGGSLGAFFRFKSETIPERPKPPQEIAEPPRFPTEYLHKWSCQNADVYLVKKQQNFVWMVWSKPSKTLIHHGTVSHDGNLTEEDAIACARKCIVLLNNDNWPEFKPMRKIHTWDNGWTYRDRMYPNTISLHGEQNNFAWQRYNSFYKISVWKKTETPGPSILENIMDYALILSENHYSNSNLTLKKIVKRSKFDHNIEFDRDTWAVSLQLSGNPMLIDSSTWMGHSKIAVEKIETGKHVFFYLHIGEVESRPKMCTLYNIDSREKPGFQRLTAGTWNVDAQLVRNARDYAAHHTNSIRYNFNGGQYINRKCRIYKPRTYRQILGSDAAGMQLSGNQKHYKEFFYKTFYRDSGHNCYTWNLQILQIMGIFPSKIIELSAPRISLNQFNVVQLTSTELSAFYTALSSPNPLTNDVLNVQL